MRDAQNHQQAASEEIAAQTAAFLARGGCIKEIPLGMGVEEMKARKGVFNPTMTKEREESLRKGKAK